MNLYRWALPLRLAITISVAAVAASSALADAPLLDFDVRRIDSKNRKFFAEAGQAERSTNVFRKEDSGPPVRLWTMPGWAHVAFLSDDGQYLAAGYEGVNLIDLNYKPDQVMVSFYERGKLVRAVRLNEIIHDFHSLERGNSHFEWGSNIGFSGLHQFVVETVEHRLLVFDVTTGLLVASEPTPPDQQDGPRKKNVRKKDGVGGR